MKQYQHLSCSRKTQLGGTMETVCCPIPVQLGIPTPSSTLAGQPFREPALPPSGVVKNGIRKTTLQGSGGRAAADQSLSVRSPAFLLRSCTLPHVP